MRKFYEIGEKGKSSSTDHLQNYSVQELRGLMAAYGDDRKREFRGLVKGLLPIATISAGLAMNECFNSSSESYNFLNWVGYVGIAFCSLANVLPRVLGFNREHRKIVRCGERLEEMEKDRGGKGVIES